MQNKGFFILGTDTNVGKTTIAVNLLSFLKANGYSTIGLKPVSSGAKLSKLGLRNSDATAMQKAATIYLPYEHVNPFCFRLAVAPHIAAEQQACQLSLAKIMQSFHPALTYKADYCVIEGLGGGAVPLNNTETMLDLLQALNLPVILVVGLRLGCLNHALLTYEILRKRNIPIVACICNQIDPDMLFHEENGLYLKQSIDVPFFSFVPYLSQNDLDCICIDWSILIKMENTSSFT
ncbi:MAG: dethiobiotin synthase [Candidatus Rickettsiella isopodorum]|jgi:dethiobiotin synthetase|nr:dethiobiotin synthase [Gammaproteobacteria bacterium]MDD4893009.1 dethiobiotin synthase [Candidatus Rickettsiella isopodorum]MDD5161452.1 dethiobiotin synthase [Candidatus Rickettsiella isopodorum]